MKIIEKWVFLLSCGNTAGEMHVLINKRSGFRFRAASVSVIVSVFNTFDWQVNSASTQMASAVRNDLPRKAVSNTDGSACFYKHINHLPLLGWI